jgi:uncharacterized protein YggT (Ycf19 family)
MALIDLILNITALLLWWNWLAIRFHPLTKTSAASLIGTLRKADPGPRRWRSMAALLALLVFRGLLYRELSSSLHWTPQLRLGVISLSFRSDYLGRTMLYSWLSFSLMLGIFYLSILLLSVVNAAVPDTDPIQRFARIHFKWLESWPSSAKLLLPFVIGVMLWLVLHPLLSWMLVVPRSKSVAQLLEQAAVIGAATYLAWKYLIVGILLLHLLNSYIYLGNHPFWSFINTTSRNLLWPLRWLPARVGKVDFLPVLAIALVFFVAEIFINPPESPAWFRPWYYHALPF